MTSSLTGLVIDAQDSWRQAAFWAAILGRQVAEDGITLMPSAPGDFSIEFEPVDSGKQGPNQMHFDLTSSSLEDQQHTVELALSLGATHLDIGQGSDAKHVVLADPEGNEFCVIEPDNSFLAGCGRIGALSGDGLQDVGRFWSAALGWPLVWDQDEETAVQSPAGGTKITWGGPPVAPKTGKNRMHLDIAPPLGTEQDAEQDAELERLIGLGATRLDIGQGDVDWAVMADPGGNEFCLLTPR